MLATKVLENPQDFESFIETVLSYEYKKEEYWGKIDGVAIALPTEVYENNFPTTIQWAIKASQTVVEVSLHARLHFLSSINHHSLFHFQTKDVRIDLPPYTAVNVTIIGNYTRLEAPYKATLIAYYADNSDGISRKIEGMVSGTNIDIDNPYQTHLYCPSHRFNCTHRVLHYNSI